MCMYNYPLSQHACSHTPSMKDSCSRCCSRSADSLERVSPWVADIATSIRSVALQLRANSRLHLLRRAAPILSPRHRETMYKGFVRPLLEYAPLVWMGSSTTSLAQLDRVQRRALRIISEHTWLPSLSLRRLCYHIPVQAPLPRPVLTAPLHYSAACGPDPQYPLHAIPQLRCLAPPTSAVERYSSHCSLQPASCFSYRDRPHLEFSPTASPRPSPVARPYAGIQGWRLPLPQASQLPMGYWLTLTSLLRAWLPTTTS